jgi:fumarate hydratase subunit beta
VIFFKNNFIKLFTTSKDPFSGLKAGDEVLLTGDIYTARDQAHKRLVELIEKGKKLPFDLKGQVIYYCGPTKTPPSKVIGSCGPTTSARMDKLTGPLLAAGLKAMIGKGRRSEEVRRLIKKYKAVYFLATGGAGAYLAKRVISVKLVSFKELGPEAIYRMRVKDFPLIVGIDPDGRDVFEKKGT